MSFLAADKANTTFKEIAKKYCYSGRFFIDVVSTLPAMFSLEKNSTAQFFKFLRFIHFQDMFIPLKRLMMLIFPNKSKFEIDDIFSV